MNISFRDVLEFLREWIDSRFLNPKVADLAEKVRCLHNHVEGIMATLAEIQAGLVSLQETSAAERLEVQSKLSDLAAQVKALQDQLAAGGGVTPAELDSVLASITSIREGIAQISEPNV